MVPITQHQPQNNNKNNISWDFTNFYYKKTTFFCKVNCCYTCICFIFKKESNLIDKLCTLFVLAIASEFV